MREKMIWEAKRQIFNETIHYIHLHLFGFPFSDNEVIVHDDIVLYHGSQKGNENISNQLKNHYQNILDSQRIIDELGGKNDENEHESSESGEMPDGQQPTVDDCTRGEDE